LKHYRIVTFTISLCGAIAACLVVTPKAPAELFYDAEVKTVYEDNVIGLLTDKRGGGKTGSGMTGTAATGAMGMPNNSPRYTGSQPSGDFSLNLFADLGGSKDISRETALFLIGSAEHTAYDTFTEFDSTIGGLSTGVSRRLSDNVSARIAFSGKLKRFSDSPRDSMSYGGNFVLKEQIRPTFFLKETYEYEKNNADSAQFSYVGNSISIWAGLQATPQTRLSLGYNYLKRDYDDPAGFTAKSHTVSAALEHELAKHWYLDAGYDHVTNYSNEPSTTATDNILSVGIRYSY
jgi:hypothetical protein